MYFQPPKTETETEKADHRETGLAGTVLFARVGALADAVLARVVYGGRVAVVA